MGLDWSWTAFCSTDLVQVHPSSLRYQSVTPATSVVTNYYSTESVVVLPPHGVQLETHYGFPLLPLMAKRRFIPMTSLQDFIIIEGLRRWNVRYYLAAVKRSGPDAFSLEAAYEVVLHLHCLHAALLTTT